MNYDQYEIIARASAFAAVAHNGQFRRGDSTVPYIVHPARVAMLVTDYGGSWRAIVAAWLHDVDEDCDECDVFNFVLSLSIPHDDKIVIIRMLRALTKDTEIESRDDRLVENMKRVCAAPEEAILIKLCDRLDNLLDYEHENLQHTYHDGFVLQYLKETDILLDHLAYRVFCMRQRESDYLGAFEAVHSRMLAMRAKYNVSFGGEHD